MEFPVPCLFSNAKSTKVARNMQRPQKAPTPLSPYAE